MLQFIFNSYMFRSLLDHHQGAYICASLKLEFVHWVLCGAAQHPMHKLQTETFIAIAQQQF
jgi:hypothetical protein